MNNVKRNKKSTKKQLAVVANRTISNQKRAASLASFGNDASKNVLGGSTHRDFLSSPEVEYHDAFKIGKTSPQPLINNNVEKTLHTQLYRSDHHINAVVTAGNSLQVAIMSASGSYLELDDTPKTFGTNAVLGVGSAAGTVSPGPCTTGTLTHNSGCVLFAEVQPQGGFPNNKFMVMKTTHSSVVAGYFNNSPSLQECPFSVNASHTGSTLRWQLTKIRVKCVNATRGADRGGVLYLSQPTNKPFDLTNLAFDPMHMAQRGVFKVYQDGETLGGTTDSDGWVTLAVRDGLCAYHARSHTSYGGLEDAAAHLFFETPLGVAQEVEIFIELHWALAGNSLRAIAKPYAVPDSAAQRASHANSVMRNANIVPSEQKGKVSIPAALALNDDAALQLAYKAKVDNAVARRGGVPPRADAHPAITAIKNMAAKHLPALIEAGVKGLAERAAMSLRLVA